MFLTNKSEIAKVGLVFLSLLFSYSIVKADESSTTENDTKQNKVSKNSNLGIATWRPINRISADVSMIGGEDRVEERRGYFALDERAVYAEGLVLDNGTIFYRRDKGKLPPITDVSARLAKINEYISYASKDELRALGISGLTSVKHHSEVDSKGQYMLTTASAESAKAQCVSFYKASHPLKAEILSRVAIVIIFFPIQ